MKKILITMLVLMPLSGIQAAKGPKLTFDAGSGEVFSLVMPNGQTVEYTAYEHLYYVTNVEDSAHQYMNVYVPKGANQKTPILLRTYAGGNTAIAAIEPQANDATGRALAEGYVVAIPDTRGWNTTTRQAAPYYTGQALLDLKAAVRYLRLFDKKMAGSAERIITNGTSAGGALSALLGTTGNNPAYEPMLKAMGAADTSDEVYACISYCPLIDLEHADMAYEWLYNCTNNHTRSLTEQQARLSNELAAQYPNYLNAMKLKDPEDGSPLTADNFRSYIKWQIIKSAQIAKNAGAVIADSIGFTFSELAAFKPPINAGARLSNTERMQAAAQLFNRGNQGSSLYEGAAARLRPQAKRQQGEYIVNLDMETYLNYVVTTQPLKTPPAFDALNVADDEEFGNASEAARLLNPMTFIGDKKTKVAPHWYIRHGARDRETSFAVPVAFAVKLQNAGKDVNFLLAWNRSHSGDYALDELFDWIRSIR